MKSLRLQSRKVFHVSLLINRVIFSRSQKHLKIFTGKYYRNKNSDNYFLQKKSICYPLCHDVLLDNKRNQLQNPCLRITKKNGLRLTKRINAIRKIKMNVKQNQNRKKFYSDDQKMQEMLKSFQCFTTKQVKIVSCTFYYFKIPLVAAMGIKMR